MQGEQNVGFRQVQRINLEELVPKNYILRHIDRAVDLSFIRKRTSGFYTEGVGRCSIPPELVLRLFLLQYLFNLSDRALCAELAMHAGWRWFCRLNFDDPIPDRSTLVKLRRLWSRAGVFDDLMQEVLRQYVDAGLVSGKAIAVDGTQVDANAAITSLEPLTPVVSLADWLKQRKGEQTAYKPKQPEDPSDTGPESDNPSEAEPVRQSGRKAGDPDFHGEKFSNQTHRSCTDRDARLYRKGYGQEAKPRYLVHQAVDLKSRVVLGTKAKYATGTAEREAALDMSDQYLPLLPAVAGDRKLVADAGYMTGWFLVGAIKCGFRPIVPMPDTAPEPIPTWERRAKNLECTRRRQRLVAEAKARNRVRQLQGPRTNRRLQRVRTKVEHSFAEAKECHGLRRARSRGLLAVHTQALLTAVVQNVKRLVAYRRRKAPKVGTSPLFRLPDDQKDTFVGLITFTTAANV